MSKRSLAAVLVLALAIGLWSSAPAWGQEQGSAPERMSLDLPSVPLGTFLKLITEQSDLKLVTSAELAGKPVSVYLPDVTAREALDAVCSAYGLEVEEREGQEILIIRKKTEKIEVREADSAIFKLEHVQAKDLLPIVRTLLGEGGNVNVDEANNILAVRAEKGDIEKVRELILEVDKHPRQVLIKAVIAELTDDAVKQLGIQWEPVGWMRGSARLTKFPFALELVESSEDPGTYGVVSFQDFFVRLEALENEGSVKILASPRITTLDNKEAVIRIVSHTVVATEITHRAGELDVIVEQLIYADVGVTLKTTPQIHDDGTITLVVEPTVSTATRSHFFEEAVDTFERSVTTTVHLKDGETIALGGLLRDDKTKQVTKVPLLSSVPILGPLLFTHTRTVSQKTDLVVFLTPIIVDSERMREDVLKLRGRMEMLPEPEGEELGPESD